MNDGGSRRGEEGRGIEGGDIPLWSDGKTSSSGVDNSTSRSVPTRLTAAPWKIFEAYRSLSYLPLSVVAAFFSSSSPPLYPLCCSFHRSLNLLGFVWLSSSDPSGKLKSPMKKACSCVLRRGKIVLSCSMRSSWLPQLSRCIVPISRE